MIESVGVFQQMQTNFEKPFGDVGTVNIDADGRVVDSELLFSGEFTRSGDSLIISDSPIENHVISDYFSGPPTIIYSQDGASILPATVLALTGQAGTQIAQSSGNTQLSEIGKISRPMSIRTPTVAKPSSCGRVCGDRGMCGGGRVCRDIPRHRVLEG